MWVPHDQAEAGVAAAIAAGGRLVTDEHAPSWWVLADTEGNEVCVATWMSRDRARRPSPSFLAMGWDDCLRALRAGSKGS